MIFLETMAPNELAGSETEELESSNKSVAEVYVEVNLKDLPKFSQLHGQVQKIVDDSSWWERHGIDWMHILVAVSTVPIALSLLNTGGVINTVVATALLGTFHCIVANKGGHLATHRGLTANKRLDKFLSMVTTEFIGSYSHFMSNYIHVDIHHPYTNIIGLGDSSSWKAPFLGREAYLFFAPLLVPVITPLVATQQLIELKQFKELLKFLTVMLSGLACHIMLLTRFAGLSPIGALFYIFAFRAIFATPYIHFNIFQHIGLPMYSQKARPVRLYQMSSGVLNLSRNSVLDFVMGHSLINCHVEHHLFPRLSDHMCLKIKPVVRRFLKTNGLPYHEDSYMNRLWDFYKRYDELMVKAPPITHFVGIQ